VARRRIIFDWAWSTLSQYEQPRILDVGCGTGYNISYLREHGFNEVVGLDFSQTALAFCRQRNIGNVVCGDATLPPFSDNVFDMILALDIVEHLEDDQKALLAWYRLLKPGGSLLIFTPAFPLLWSLQDEVGHHFRRYRESELRHKQEAAGFHIARISYANFFLFPLVWAGRTAFRWWGNSDKVVSEADLHPTWTNGILKCIFAAERPLLRYIRFPFGVSLISLATKLNTSERACCYREP
jgi:SAM-dependent methyltransferase